MTAYDYGQEETTPTELHRPTLIIGLGGTGALVVQRLKRLLRQKFGERGSEMFQLLVLDTTSQAFSASQDLDASEFINLAERNIPGNKIIDTMVSTTGLEDIYGGLKDWWPVTKDDRPFRPGDIIFGAKATRCVGRMALWWYGNDLYRAIQRKINNILSTVSLNRSEVAATGNAAKLFVISSLAGGTGSGMFLDVAYLARHVMEESNLNTVSTALLLADSSLFVEKIHEDALVRRMEANIYAALCELDHCMTDGQLPHTQPRNDADQSVYRMFYSSELEVKSSEKPFNVCFLLTSMNENNRRVRNLGDLTEMMAQEIFLEIATPLGQTGHNMLDNVEQLSRFSRYGPRPMAYSSFAVSSLNLTSEVIRKVCSLTLTEQAIERLLRLDNQAGNSQPDPVVDQMRSFPVDLETANTAFQRLVERILESNNTDMPELRYPSNIMPEQLQNTLNNIYGRLNEAHANTIRPAYKMAHDRFIQRYQENMAKLLHTMLASTMSLRQIDAQLASWRSRVERAFIDMGDRRKNAERDIPHAQQRINDGLQRLRKKASTGVKWWPFGDGSRASQSTADRLLVDLRSYDESLRDSLRWSALAEVFEELLTMMSSYRQNIESVTQLLRQEQENVHEDRKRLLTQVDQGSNQYQLQFQALRISDVNLLVDILSRQLSHDGTAMIVRELLQRPGGDVNQLEQKTRASVDSWFATTDLFKMLDLIRSSDNGSERQLRKLMDYAAPFWTLSSTYCPEINSASLISLMGYNGAGTSAVGGSFELLLQQVGDEVNLVNIPERDQVVLLKTKHGIPLFALSVTNGQMRSSYRRFKLDWENGQPGSRPIHISQEWYKLPDFNPTPLRGRETRNNGTADQALLPTSVSRPPDATDGMTNGSSDHKAAGLSVDPGPKG